MKDWQALYQTLWKERTFSSAEEAMRNELLDERTHPRLRKRPEDKFVEAVRRVRQSPLSEKDKLTLIWAYMDGLDRVSRQFE